LCGFQQSFVNRFANDEAIVSGTGSVINRFEQIHNIITNNMFIIDVEVVNSSVDEVITSTQRIVHPMDGRLWQ